jgi:hypothetical protein
VVGGAIQFHGVFSLLTECAFVWKTLEWWRVLTIKKERISPQRKNEVRRERGEFEG